MVTITVAIGAMLSLGACGDIVSLEPADSSQIDSTPQKLNGSSSYEFETDDIERAESASPAVQAYCEDAVSEAQEIGCLSHVDESDIP